MSLGGCGGGSGSSSGPIVQPPPAPAPDPTTSIIDDLIFTVGLAFSDDGNTPRTQSLRVGNEGELRFVGTAESQWGVFIGDNLKAVPSQLFPEEEQELDQAVLTGDLAGLEIAPTANEPLTIEVAVQMPPIASYYTVCALVDNEPVFSTCGLPLQLFDDQDTAYPTGDRPRLGAFTGVTGFTGEGGNAIFPFPEVSLKSFSTIEDNSVKGTVFFVESVAENFLNAEAGSYKVIAFDPNLPGFVPGQFADILAEPIPTGVDFDLLGVPQDGAWPALTTMASVEGFDPQSASTASFFVNLQLLPEQLKHCIVANDNNTILFCTEALVRGFVGPPACADGYIEDGTEGANIAACDDVSMGQDSCQAEIIGDTLLSDDGTQLEIGATVQVQGCNAEEQVLVVVTAPGLSIVGGPGCGRILSSADNICAILPPQDGSYEISYALFLPDFCELTLDERSLFLASDFDSPVSERLDTLDLSPYCDVNSTAL